jgi:hypothetical protein
MQVLSVLEIKVSTSFTDVLTRLLPSSSGIQSRREVAVLQCIDYIIKMLRFMWFVKMLYSGSGSASSHDVDEGNEQHSRGSYS